MSRQQLPIKRLVLTDDSGPADVTAAAVDSEIKNIVGDGVELPEEVQTAVGEVCVPCPIGLRVLEC